MTRKELLQNWECIEGKIAVFIMTFSGDKLCLNECLRSIDEQKKKGYDLEVFVIDDANSPLDKDTLPDFVNYTQSKFNRNGNLNGTQCSIGMLMEMTRCVRECNAQYLLKVDSDMVIRSLDRFLSPLKENPDCVLGFQLSKDQNYCSGVTYCLPAKGLYKTVKNFYKWFLEEKNDKENSEGWITNCPEDWAITRCVASVNDFVMIQWNNNKSCSPEHWLLSPFNFREVNEDGSINPLIFTKYKMYDFVNFGNRYELGEPDVKCKKLLDKMTERELAAFCMKSFVECGLNSK